MVIHTIILFLSSLISVWSHNIFQYSIISLLCHNLFSRIHYISIMPPFYPPSFPDFISLSHRLHVSSVVLAVLQPLPLPHSDQLLNQLSPPWSGRLLAQYPQTPLTPDSKSFPLFPRMTLSGGRTALAFGCFQVVQSNRLAAGGSWEINLD